MIVEWKHRKAEAEIEPLLQHAARLDPELVTKYPRAVKDILCASLPVAFESHRRLSATRVVEVLGDVYGVDHRQLLADGDGSLAGYTFARGEIAVVFTDPQHGEAFERFTLAHETAHLAVEYLPSLNRSRQAELFGGAPVPALFARRDPPGHIFAGNGPASTGASELGAQYRQLQANRKAWLREVVANACAAEILAPHRDIGRLLGALPPGTDPARALQAHFGLSRRAADVRLSELGLTQVSPHHLSFLLD